MARTRTIFLAALLAAPFVLPLRAVDAAPASTDYDGPQWPNVALPAPKDTLEETARSASFEARWPSLSEDSVGSIRRRADAPPVVEAPARRWEVAGPAPFSVEGGTRYWYSTGNMKFGFANQNPLYGDPTSTLDWDRLTGHAGEVFARIDHNPSGFYVKGVAGLGKIVDGNIIDRDFFANQIKFSDTSSDVRGDDVRYAIIDLGWAYHAPQGGQRWGLFAGYHYWREKANAFGVRCNPDDVAGAVCGSPGAVPIDFSTPVLSYEPRWHAVRLGVDWKVDIDERWSFSGEAAWVPYAVLRNEDSHLQRQDPTDLGPAPNVISTSNRGYGGSAEVFLNYALTPNIELGTGLRYWGMFTDRGTVQFGPTFANDSPLRRFEEQRYGVLFQIKGKI